MMKLIEQFSSGNRSFNLASFIKVHQTITRTFVKSILSYILCLHNLLTSIGGHHNAPDALTWNSRHRLWLYARANIRITSLHCSLPVESEISFMFNVTSFKLHMTQNPHREIVSWNVLKSFKPSRKIKCQNLQTLGSSIGRCSHSGHHPWEDFTRIWRLTKY